MTTTDYQLTGLTCAHCVAAVTQEVSALDGVQSLELDLVAGGISTLRVTSTAALAAELVRAAVEEAGYEFAEA